MTNNQKYIQTRFATEADVAFIMDAWLKTMRKESRWTRDMESEIFYRNHRRLVEELLMECHTLLAVDYEDPLHLLGFATGALYPEALVLHFVYTKFSFRGHGVALALAQAWGWDRDTPIVATHWTRSAERLATKYLLVYNPYLLFGQFRSPADEKRTSKPQEGHLKPVSPKNAGF